jgi:hypothetical protein
MPEKGMPMLAMIVPLLLAATALSADDRHAMEERVVEIFAPYRAADVAPAWEQPIYTAEVAALIAEWRAVAPHDEPDALSDGDWLCQCQDWNEEAFTATITSIDAIGADRAEVEVDVDLGFAEPASSLRRERLVLKREDGVWKIDDLVAESFAAGLKQALRETIAADKTLAGERG